MKRRIFKMVVLFSIVMIVLLVRSSVVFCLPYELSFSGTLLGYPGDLVTVLVDVTVPNGNQLVSADLNIGFDDAVLSYSEARPVGDLFLVADPTLDPSPVSMSIMSLLSLPGPGVYNLAEIDFLIKDSAPPGQTLLAFVGSETPQGFVGVGDELLGDVPLSDIIVHGAAINITSIGPVVIPEPSTLLMLGFGLGVLLIRKRKMNSPL